MQPEIQKLLAFLFEEEEKASDYQAVLNILSAYIEAELDGQDAAMLFPEVSAALETYPLLQKVYQDARALLDFERQGTLREPTTRANFDFSYLAQQTPSYPTRIWRTVQRRGREVSVLFCKLRLVLSPKQAFFDQLPPPLAIKWEILPMPSRTQVEPQPIPVLSLLLPEHDLSLRLVVMPPEPEKEEATLVIELRHTPTGQAVPRCRIILRDDNYRMLESHFTEEDGRVSFTNLLAGPYVVDIKYKGRVSQIQIEVAWADEMKGDF